ncbi:hypothetical protein [Winogradskyella sp.]|uniref:hypothetical protein n=1 Tax=Winogradskyella sp. TaxID=1883156 RepID=UPI003BA9D437
MKISSILILLVILNSLSIHSQEFDYSFKEAFKTSEPVKLNIASSDSNIEVVSHDKNVVEVYFVVKKGKKLLDINKSQLYDAIKGQSQLNIENSTSQLNIELKNIAKGYLNHKNAILIDFIVRVPKQTSAHLQSSDGSILLQGLIANQSCFTSDGGIELIDLNGDITAKTSDGPIIATNIIGDLTAITSDGNIKLKDVDGGGKAITSDGDIYLSNVNGNIYCKAKEGEVVRVND